jgi:hypothetical protein
MLLLVTTLLTAWIAVGPGTDAPDEFRDASLRAIVEAAFPDGTPASVDVEQEGNRAGFLEVLSSELFIHEEVGPFDLFVLKADGLASSSVAKKLAKNAAQGLEAIVPVMERYFGGEAGLVAGRRFPIVLADSSRQSGEHGFDQLVALLDWSEGDYSGWKASGNPVWSNDVRAGVTVRTWEVQLFNLDHAEAADQGEAFFDHGLGYYTLAHVSARVLRQGAWGLVPPWLAQGLIDELDIAAYGEAWVGGDTWERQTAGWYRPGWSGFVPQGSSPPPPVTGPPADLAVTIKETGDSWQSRTSSSVRHWNELAADGLSEAPASFEFMALNESFLPRDRAFARCALHLLLDVAHDPNQGLLTDLLDRAPSTPPSGMPDSDPITLILDRALGGVPEVAALEALSLEDMLDVIGRPEISRDITRLGGKGMLELSDHREQAEWLFHQPTEELDWDARNELWSLILSAEYYQQLREWELLGKALDRGTRAALEASSAYPEQDSRKEVVATSFQDAVSS